MKFTILVQPYMRSRGEGRSPGLPGRDRDRFSRLLERLTEQMQFADAAGYDGMCMTEQHMQVEGIEVTTNPLLYGLFVAQHTKNLRVGQLGIPLTTRNPIAVAEDLALADHFTNGRLFCGFSRGNTPRWAETFAQHLGLSSATSDKSAQDVANREAFYEAWHIIKSLWTDDLTAIDGKYWKVPVRTTHWDWNPTNEWGRGVDESHTLQEVGIVPRPLQDPYPPVYAPFAFSMESARFWAREGGKLVSYVPNDDFVKTTIDVYQKEAADAGRNVTPADALAIGAHLVMGRNERAVDDLMAGFTELFDFAYDTPPYKVPMGRVFKGIGPEVAQEVTRLNGELGVEEFVLWHHVGYFDQAQELEMLEAFASSVIGKFR
jgi:alkanesulfonate monooxygenase SsuD/methylene tetrahydromethanopterin reductase-like flavin-dependent oxidoreductase (luciferase family)